MFCVRWSVQECALPRVVVLNIPPSLLVPARSPGCVLLLSVETTVDEAVGLPGPEEVLLGTLFRRNDDLMSTRKQK